VLGKIERMTVGVGLCLLITAVVSAEVTRKTVYNSDGTATQVFYSEGKEIAERELDKNGNIVNATGTIPDGSVNEYYASGNLGFECNYTNNKPEGKSRIYYKSGQLRAELYFKEGILDGMSRG